MIMAEWEWLRYILLDLTLIELGMKSSKLYQPFTTVKGGKSFKCLWVFDIGTYFCLKVVFLLVFSYILIIVMKKVKFV